MRPLSWLFTRGLRSVRLVREGDSSNIVLFVHGPGDQGSVYTFDHEETHFRRFVTGVERQLLADGWTFRGLDLERRSGSDRRRTPRPTVERRRGWL